MEPLEVFALDENMNRLTGSIPYKSLQWSRKYYEPGTFTMVVPSNIYSSEWAYVYCDARPETGIVQKVEYTDSAVSSSGIDEITVSGFFMEQMLNNYTFLAEETEQKTITKQKPQPVKTKMPNLIKAEDGKLYTELEWWSNGEQNFSYMDVETGQAASKPAGEYEYMELDAAEGYEEIFWPTDNTDKYPDGKWSAGYYKTYYSYYTEDGELHSIDPDGVDTVVENVIGTPRGTAIIDDGDGTYSWLGGISQLESQTYYRRAQAWEYNIINRPGVVVSEDGNTITYQVEVKGPWQLRTDIGEVGTPVDNVQTVIKWCQRAFGNSLTYDEAPFEGVEKEIDPSFERMGDLFYSELKTVEASLRLLYDFELNQCVFQVWRGFDRTQNDDGQAAETTEQPSIHCAKARVAQYFSVSPSQFQVPIGYSLLDYIESSGTQYIDLGYGIPSSYDFEIDYQVTSAPSENVGIFGSRDGESVNGYMLFCSPGSGFSFQYGSQYIQNILPSEIVSRLTASKTGNSIRIGSASYSLNESSFTVDRSQTIFAFNYERGMELSSMRLYSMMYTSGGSTIHDLVPARRESDGLIGVYDKETGSFHTNSGTGSFSFGSVVSTPAEIIYDRNAQDATGSMGATYSFVGSDEVLPDSGFIRDGYVFSGWGTEPSGGSVYANGDTFRVSSYTTTLYAQWALSDSLFYFANSVEATGATPPTQGYVGESVIVSGSGFSLENGTFAGWNTEPDGSGIGYDPGDMYLLTSGNDYLYAQWDIDVPVPDQSDDKAPWAVFSDTWGTMYGYTASVDDSNYRNLCYVLYEYDEPEWEDNGKPSVKHDVASKQWYVMYNSKRSYLTVRLEDDYPDLETYLDMRDEKPSCDEAWSRDPYDYDPTDELEEADVKRSVYRSFSDSLYSQGEKLLIDSYPIVHNLDTGTLSQSDYIHGFDLGDLVDMEVSSIGIKKTARIIGVDETYEAGSSEINIEIGDELVTIVDKSKLV